MVALSKRLDSVVVEILKSGANANVFAQESHDTALHLAADRGQTALVIKLIGAGAMVDATNKKGETALHRATTQNHLEVVKNLVRLRADVNLLVSGGDRATALHIAAKKRLLPIVKMLIDASANVNLRDNAGQTPLHKAARGDNSSDEEGKMLFFKAAEVDQGGLAVMECLIAAGVDVNAKDKDGNTALHLSASGQPKTLECLLFAGADTSLANNAGKTVFHMALAAASEGNIDYLARVANEANEALASLSDLGQSLSLLAAQCLWPAVTLLFRSGADVNVRSQELGMTALHHAAGRNQKDVAGLLIAHGSDPNAVDDLGRTALHYAAASGFVEVAALLLKVTDTSIQDRREKTALRCARDSGQGSTVKMLLPFAGPSDNCVDERGRTLVGWKDIVHVNQVLRTSNLAGSAESQPSSVD